MASEGGGTEEGPTTELAQRTHTLFLRLCLCPLTLPFVAAHSKKRLSLLSVSTVTTLVDDRFVFHLWFKNRFLVVVWFVLLCPAVCDLSLRKACAADNRPTSHCGFWSLLSAPVPDSLMMSADKDQPLKIRHGVPFNAPLIYAKDWTSFIIISVFFKVLYYHCVNICLSHN